MLKVHLPRGDQPRQDRGKKDEDNTEIRTQHSQFSSRMKSIMRYLLEPVLVVSERGVPFRNEGPTSCLVQQDHDTVRGVAVQRAAQGQVSKSPED